MSVFLIILYSVLSDIFNSYRWVVISKHSCSFQASSEAYFLTSMLNILLPGRVGELSRFFYLKRYYKIPYNKSISIFTIDRSLDIIFLAFATVIGVEFFFTTQQPYIYPTLFILLFFLLFYLVKYKKQNIFIFLKYIPSKFLRVYIKKIIKNISNNISTKIVLTASFYTLMVWFINGSFFVIFLKYVVHFDLTVSQSLLVYLASAIGMAIPLAPAGIGTFHFAVIYILSNYGIIYEKAVATSILLHLIQIFPSLIGGLFVVLNYKIDINKVQK